MHDMGFSSIEVLRGTNINERMLDNNFTLIGIPEYIRIVSNMMELSHEPALGFRLGNYLHSGDLGALGCAVAASQNFKEGMDIWHNYNSLFFGDLLEVRRSHESGMLQFECIPRVPLRPQLLQFFMEEKMGVEIALGKKWHDFVLSAKYISLTYPRPQHGQLYDELLPVKVEFGADRNLYSIDPQDPNYLRQFEGANKEVRDLCLGYVRKVVNIAGGRETLSPQVRQIFMASLPEIPTLSNIAGKLNMSDRTLCRHLKNEKSSYKILLASVREELAKNYLLTTEMNVDQIAQQLGFKETSSLYKAFKKWTGTTIKVYRENYHNGLSEKQ